MAIEHKPVARFRNEAQGLSIHFPAHWSCSTSKSNDGTWALVDDGPMANVRLTRFTLDEFTAKWQIFPQKPIDALNPYLIYSKPRDEKIHSILDESPINRQQAFSMSYRDKSGRSEAGKRRVAILHEHQIAIIEAEWETSEHQTWVSQIIASVKIEPPQQSATAYHLKMRHLAAVVAQPARRELQMPYPLVWSFEYQPAAFGQQVRFNMNSGHFSFHYFLNQAAGSSASPILFDDHIQIERQTMGLNGKPAWELVQTGETITAVHPFNGGVEAVIGKGEQTLYLISDIAHTDFIRNLVSGIALESEAATLEEAGYLTCLESIAIEALPTGAGTTNGRHSQGYYALRVDKQDPIADGVDGATAVFTARDDAWQPIAGKPFTIQTQPEVEIQQKSSTTSADGQITAIIKSEKTTDISVFALNESQQTVTLPATVSFKPRPNQYSLTIDKKELWADGEDQVLITVTARDGQGLPLSDHPIRLQTSPDTDLKQTVSLTNEAGELHGSLTCTEIQTIELSATDDQGNQLTPAQIITAVSPIDGQQSSMILEEEDEPAAGEDVVKVTLFVRDEQDQPVAHRAVTIKTSPPIDTIQATAVTDMDGCLHATLRSARPVTVHVIAVETERDWIITEMDIRIVPPPQKIRTVPPRISKTETEPGETAITPSASSSAAAKEAADKGIRHLRWLMPLGLILFGLILFALIWCNVNEAPCGPCQFWRACRQQPLTAVKGPPTPILSLRLAGPTELSDNGRYMIIPIQAASPLFVAERQSESGTALTELITIEEMPDQTERGISIRPGSFERGSEPNLITFQLLFPADLLGEAQLLTINSGGYQAQIPLIIQSIPRAQISAPQTLADISFQPEAQTIAVEVDGRVVPVGSPAQWEFTFWDPTSGELLGSKQTCSELKGTCLLTYDFSNPCLVIDIKLIGQTDAGLVQASEQFTECP